MRLLDGRTDIESVDIDFSANSAKEAKLFFPCHFDLNMSEMSSHLI